VTAFAVEQDLDLALAELQSARQELQQLRTRLAVRYAYPVWECFNAPGCGARYTHKPYAHPCGPLTPVTVTVTDRTEGA
jgi:hypothetical protein